jgi:hypothetical protein
VKEPTRLLSGGASDFERELLRSWEAEQPSEEERAKVLAMAGVGAGAAAVLAKAGSSLAPKAGVTGVALAKWLLLGVVGATVAAGSFVYVDRARRGGARLAGVAARVSPSPSVALTASTLPPVAPPSVAPPLSPADAPVAPAPAAQDSLARRPSPLRHPASATGARSKDDALGEQVSALDRARRTLASGDPPDALRQLDDYAARFPHGALVQEAEALRIESLLAANDRPAAAQAGARFLASHPGSPLAARVHALVAQAAAP